MVGIAKWQDEWVAHIFECKRTSPDMDNDMIAESLRKKFPRTKDFHAGGVKYVLQTRKDPSLPNDQVLSSGVKKKKSTKGSKPPAKLENALSNALSMVSPAISVASSFGPSTQSQPKVVGGRQSATRLDNPTPMDTLASRTSSSPSLIQNNMGNMGYPIDSSGSRAYYNDSVNLERHRYPAVLTAGASIENPYTIDDDGNNPARYMMQRSSTNQQSTTPYQMGSNNLQQGLQNNVYAQRQNGQKNPALSNQMTGFMNEQTQNVHRGFRNPTRAGLGPASQENYASSVLQNYLQPYKRAGAEDLEQTHQSSHGIPNTNSSAVYQGFGDNLATGNSGSNSHGLPAVSKPVNGKDLYNQSGQPSSHNQGMLSEQDNQNMMGSANNVAGIGTNNTNATIRSRSLAAPKNTSMGEHVQVPSSSEVHRAPDAFDFSEEEQFFPDHHLFDGTNNHDIISLSIPQPEANFQNVGKRKRQEEGPAQMQISAVTGERSNDLLVHPPKRQKQDNSGATLRGCSRSTNQNNQTAPQFPMEENASQGNKSRLKPPQQSVQSQNPIFTPMSQSQRRLNQGSATVAGNARAMPLAVVGSGILGYNDQALRFLQYGKDGEALRNPNILWKRHLEFLKNLLSRQGNKLSFDQRECAEMYAEKLRRMLPASQASSITGSQTSQSQRACERAQGSRPSGMPQSSLSYARQENVTMGNNSGSTLASASQIGQKYIPGTVRDNMSSHSSSGKPQYFSTNPSYMHPPPATPDMDRGDMPVSQNDRFAGHKFNGPPVSHQTPSMDRSATIPHQQSRISVKGATAGTGSQLPENINRYMALPQQIQSIGNRANAIQVTGGDCSQPITRRAHSASSFPISQMPSNAAGPSVMQTATHQLASTPTQKSTSLPDLNTRHSLSWDSVSTHLPQTQREQGQTLNGVSPNFQRQQAPFDMSRIGNSSSGNALYQVPHVSNADPKSRDTANQVLAHDKPLHRVVNSTSADGAWTHMQASGIKTPIPGSKSGTGSEPTPPTSTVSPSTRSEDSTGHKSIYNGVPFETKNVNVVEVVSPVFHQHFTFPSESEGWTVILNHLDEKHLLMQGKNNILLVSPIFMGGVTWPKMSNQAASNKAAAQKPRRKAPVKEATTPSSVAATSNARATSPNPISRPRTSTFTVPEPHHPPLWPGERFPATAATSNTSNPAPPSSFKPVPPPPHPPLWPGEKSPITAVTMNNYISSQQSTAVNSQGKKLDVRLDFKDVNPKISMRKAGSIESQTDPGFRGLIDNTLDDDDDDLFGDGEVFYQGNNDDQVSDPLASTNAEDQTSNQSPSSTVLNPTVSFTSQVLVSDALQQADKNSISDEAQPATLEILAPAETLPNLLTTTQPGQAHQESCEAQNCHVHFENRKPIEEDTLTSENQIEWRARRPAYQPPNPFANANKKTSPPSLPDPTQLPQKADPLPWENLTELEQEWASVRQAKWLQDVFPDFPSRERLDVTCVNRPPTESIDFNKLFRETPGAEHWSDEETLRALIREDFDDHGDLAIRAALDMLAYVRKWGELCTQFDEAGKPIMDAPPDPSRVAHNEQMRVDLASDGPKSKKAADLRPLGRR
ncbi:hypothetical protein ONS96_010038 [Cadophora gregata f. sp. sojae]|nr:hypothetical protein ONS96_010038 [Cadophora gregata f. sp. sojae]